MTSVARNATTLAWWARVFAVLTVAVALVALPIMQGVASAHTSTTAATTSAGVTAAGSTTPTTAFPTSSQDAVDGGGESASVKQVRVSNDKFLPMNRWEDATGVFHTRNIGSKFNPSTHLRQYSRDVVSGSAMALGNSLWSMTAWVTSSSMRFDPLDSIGHAVDNAAASIGEALIGKSGSRAPSLLLLFLVIGIVGSFWDSYRRGTSFFKDIIVRLAVMAMFALMVGGAMSSTDTKYGKFSPGWMVDTLNTTISQIASAPAALVTMDDLEPESGTGQELMSCQRYNTELRKQYAESFDIRSGRTDLHAAMPLVLNGMWESTSLESWKSAQFGGSSHGDYVGCRLLDQIAGVPVSGDLDAYRRGYLGGSTTIGVMNNYWTGGNLPDLKRDSIAFDAVNDITRDVSLVGWAACKWDTSREDWVARTPDLINPSDLDVRTESIEGTAKDQGDDGGTGCGGWWTQSAKSGRGGYDDGSSFLNWSDRDEINEELTKDNDRDFILGLHGENWASAMATSVAYVVSSVMVAVVFTGFSVVILFLKIAMVALMMSVLAYLAVSLLPRVNVGEKLGGFFKSLLGMILLTAGAILLFSVVGMMTRLVMRIGTGFFSAGSVPSMLWTGLAPLLAFLTLAWTFKKVLGSANPLSIKGALAWGGAAGMVGGAVGSTMQNQMNRAGRSAQNRAGDAAKDVGGRAVSAATGGRVGQSGQGGRAGDRHGAMTPRDRNRSRVGQRDSDKALTTGAVGAGAAGAAGLSSLDKYDEDGKKLTPADRRALQAGEDSRTLEGIDPALAAAPGSAAAREALRTHRAERVKQARELQDAQWRERNQGSAANKFKDRRSTPITGRNGEELQPGEQGFRRARLRRDSRAAFDASVGDRTAAIGQSFKEAPMATIGRGAKKVAKPAAIGLAAATIGAPALPILGTVAAVGAARKGMSAMGRTKMATSTRDRIGGDGRALANLAQHEAQGGSLTPSRDRSGSAVPPERKGSGGPEDDQPDDTGSDDTDGDDGGGQPSGTPSTGGQGGGGQTADEAPAPAQDAQETREPSGGAPQQAPPQAAPAPARQPAPQAPAPSPASQPAPAQQEAPQAAPVPARQPESAQQQQQAPPAAPARQEPAPASQPERATTQRRSVRRPSASTGGSKEGSVPPATTDQADVSQERQRNEPTVQRAERPTPRND